MSWSSKPNPRLQKLMEASGLADQEGPSLSRGSRKRRRFPSEDLSPPPRTGTPSPPRKKFSQEAPPADAVFDELRGGLHTVESWKRHAPRHVKTTRLEDDPGFKTIYREAITAENPVARVVSSQEAMHRRFAEQCGTIRKWVQKQSAKNPQDGVSLRRVEEFLARDTTALRLFGHNIPKGDSLLEHLEQWPECGLQIKRIGGKPRFFAQKQS